MVPLNDFQRQWAELGGEMLTASEAVGESGWYILGAKVRQFEDALADYRGPRHAMGVASGPDQPVMAGLHHEVAGECREARRFCGEEVSLPMHPFPAGSEKDQVVAACNCWGR